MSVIILIIIGAVLFSLTVTVGVVWLICLCFGWTFTIWYGIGVWLVLFLLKGLFGSNS